MDVNHTTLEISTTVKEEDYCYIGAIPYKAYFGKLLLPITPYAFTELD